MEVEIMKIWIDIKNSHEPLFFKSFLDNIPEHNYSISCRSFAEIESLLKKYNINYKKIGGRPEGSMIKRILGFYGRVCQLFFKVPNFDVSLNHMSLWAIYVSKLRFKKNITLGDNEINHMLNKRMFKYVDYFIAPKALPKKTLVKDNLKEDKLHYYNGYKEDIYIADFKPDKNFMKDLPFKEFVTIRPESIQATYVPKNVVSIVPDLIKRFSKENINILFLPRYESDKLYAKGFKNVYIPKEPLNGLDVCHNTKAMLTGAGTFAREAACMGTPSISFFPGKVPLSVDQEMIKDKKILHSRDPKEIIDYVLNCKKRKVNLSRSKKVQKEVFGIVQNILSEIK